MLEVLESCLQPEPAKRLTALEVLALPYFDDILEILDDMGLQDEYDQAYAQAADAHLPSAHSLWTACRACTAKRLEKQCSPVSVVDRTMDEETEGLDMEYNSDAGASPPLGHVGCHLVGRSSSMVLIQSAPEAHPNITTRLQNAEAGAPMHEASRAIANHSLRRSATMGDKQSDEMYVVLSFLHNSSTLL